jgi:transposase
MASVSHTTKKHIELSKDELLALLQQQNKATKKAKHLINAQQRHIEKIEAYLKLAKHQRFSVSSEKSIYQVDFFDEVELEVTLSELEAELPEDRQAKVKPKCTQTRGFSDKLPRVRQEHLLSEADKAGAIKIFFVKEKEELEFIPAQCRVIEHRHEKAVFEDDHGDTVMKKASRPVHPLGKCRASTSLLTHILVSKYADGLPLYRQEGILKRYDASISRTSMANWMMGLEPVLLPLINLAREHQLEGNYLQADETRLQVLKETGKSATSDKWMWVIRGGPPGQPVVLFEYDPSRSGEVPTRLLAGFKGVLQADGYSNYNAAHLRCLEVRPIAKKNLRKKFRRFERRLVN